MKLGFLVFAFVRLSAQAQDLFLSRSKLDTPVGKASPFDFSCNAACVATEAKLQGADVLTSLANLKYSMEVHYSAGPVSGEACGQMRHFPSHSVKLDPSGSVKLTTAHTRSEPDITFECTPGKSYNLVLNDALGGVFQNTTAYTHWLKLNMVCPASGLASVAGNGRDMAQGTPPVPGWFSGKGYLFPAFPYNTLHHFNFYIFERPEPFTSARLDEVDKEFPSHNHLGGTGANAPYTIDKIMSWLGFEAPVARTWMDVTTSYWSKIRMDGVARMFPAMSKMEFYQLICPCNLPKNQPGLFRQGADPRCNL